MEWTVALIEAELLVRLGPYLRRVGLNGTAADGTNAALRGPIRGAVWSLGLATADPVAVADADVAGMGRPSIEKLLDLAELRALEVCYGNWPWFDQSSGEESQSLSQLAAQLRWRIEFLTDEIAKAKADKDAQELKPGPSSHGLIAAGRCIPGTTRPWDWTARGACR